MMRSRWVLAFLYGFSGGIAYSAAIRSRRGPIGNATFDYVVVGGGTAGITIASRLAEDPSISVALIEAGGFYEKDNGNFSTIPGLSLSAPFLSTAVPFQPQPLVDWGLVSIPQAGAAGREIHYPQGKTLGGSSAINSMAYHRATIGTYDRWASLVGDQSYTFANLLPFFKKTCHLTPPNFTKRNTPNSTVLYDPTAFEANAGPLQVSWPNWVDTPLTWFQKAFGAIGLPVSHENFNSGNIIPNSAWVATTVEPTLAMRSSSQSAFQVQNMSMNRLTTYYNTQARKILFNSSDRNQSSAAIGVSATGINREIFVSARKEVIVSAGVFHSPQLLMVSGVGPRSTLAKYAIPVLSNLPGVGQNLWDQILFPVTQAMNIPTAAQLITEPQFAAQTKQEYIQDAAGPLSSENGFIAFEKVPDSLRKSFTTSALSQLATLPQDWPEVEYITNSAVAPTGAGLGVILAALPGTFSRGSVTISSADISTPPLIDLGWLSDPNNIDAQVAVAAFRRIRQAWSSIPNITIGPELAPGPAVRSDADVLAYIRNATMTLYHAAGTCAMGRQTDENAVVDSSARVFGVRNLRVVDNSASPFAMPGHPQSTVYMLAEKIADLIKRGG